MASMSTLQASSNPLTHALMKCLICLVPRGCAFFDPVDGNLDLCHCGHSRENHESIRILPPRGGHPSANCSEFTTRSGLPPTNFHENCGTCANAYSEHQRRPQNLLPPNIGGNAGPSLPTSQAPAVTHAPPGPAAAGHGQFVAPPASQPMLPMAASMPVLTAAAGLSQQPATSQMPLLQPYQGSTHHASGSTSAFGVPMGEPGPPVQSAGSLARRGQSNNRRGGQRYHPAQNAAHPIRQHRRTLRVLGVLHPLDMHPTVRQQDTHGLPGPTTIARGERLAEDLEFMESQGLTHMFTLNSSSSSENLLPQIATQFEDMIRRGNFQYPEIPDSAHEPIHLSPNADNRYLRNLFNKLPFRILSIGYDRSSGDPRLFYDERVDLGAFEQKRFRDRFSRGVTRHPTLSHPECDGHFHMCVKGGLTMRGPLVPNSTEMHICWTDFIVAGLAKSSYTSDHTSELSLEERQAQWAQDFPHSCRQNCPGQPPVLPPTPVNRNLDADDDWEPPATILPLGFTRRSARLDVNTASSSSSTLSPLVSTLGLDVATPHPPQQPLPNIGGLGENPNHPVSTTPATSIANERFEMPVHSDSDTDIGYPATANGYACLSDLAVSLEAACHNAASNHDDWFRVEALSVAAAADGLIKAIRSAECDPTRDIGELGGVVKPAGVTVQNVYSYPVWHFRAGLTTRDATGHGVMREVLMTAILKLLEPEHGLVQETNNGDGYFTLRLSHPMFVSEESLSNAFTLGVLCAIFMVKGHNGPDPVSPALIQAAIDGIDTIIDFEWLDTINPEIARKLSLLPTDPSIPIPTADEDLKRLIAVFMPTFRMNDVLQSAPNQREGLVRELHSHVLLGASHGELHGSQEFAAFKKGFDLYLGAPCPSLIDKMRGSSKCLLYDSYNRHLKNALDLLPYINYDVQGNADFMVEAQELLPEVKRMMTRYLLGKGDPFPARVDGLVSDEARASLMPDDPCYRAKRFVKVLSGLPLLPSRDNMFTVTLRDVRTSSLRARYGYNIQNDCIPPTIHSCFQQMEIWVNEPVKTAIAASDRRLGVDTDFDWFIHTSLLQIAHDDYNA